MDKRILIIKQLTGDISLEERKQLKEWLDASPENVNQRNQIRSDWRLAKEAKEASGIDAEIQINTLLDTVRLAKVENLKSNPKRKGPVVAPQAKSTFLIWPWLIGLGIFLALSATYVFYPRNTEVAQKEIGFTTMLGEVRSHVLPRDSKVWLNGESELSYVEEQSLAEQNYNFTGEGFFEFNSEEGKVSTVQLSKVILKTKNASFNISDKQKVSFAQIHVAKGEIQIFDLKGNEVAQVKANQSGKYAYENKKFEPDAKFNPNATSWKSNSLVFNDTPLGQVLSDVETYFERNVLLEKKKLNTCKFSGTFDEPDINLILSKVANQFEMQLTQGVHGDYVLRRGICK